MKATTMDFFRTAKRLPSATSIHQIAAPRPLKHSGSRNATFEPAQLSFEDDDRMEATTAATFESLNEWQTEAEAELRQILGCCGFQTDSLFDSTDEMSIEIPADYPFNRALMSDNEELNFPRLGASPAPVVSSSPPTVSPPPSYTSSSLTKNSSMAISLTHQQAIATATTTDFLFSSPPCRARNPVTCNTPFGLISDDELDVDALLPTLAQQLRLDLTIDLPSDAPRTRNRSYSEPVPFVPLVGS